MKKFLAFLKQLFPPIQRAPDKNVATIGEHVQIGQFAQGSNILQLQIGAFIFPVRTLLALIAVLLLIAFGVWWFAIDGKMPAGSSVAIVDFAEKTANGQLSFSDAGKRYAEYMSDQMQRELSTFPFEPAPTLWHIATGFDPLAVFWKRLTFAPVGDDTQAQSVADDFLAQVVVYGFVESGAEGINITPKFYARQAKGEADELSDPQQMGQPITIARGNDKRLDTHLYPLSKALLYISEGLWAELDGDFAQAYTVFKRAEENLRSEVAFPRELGKEVLYYFLGESALFLSACETDARQVFTDPNLSASLQALDAAQAAFARSKEISAEQGRVYPRAIFGLAQTQFARGIRVLIPPEHNTAGQCKIPQAADNPNEPNVPQYVCPALPVMSSTELWDEARVNFDNALMLYDEFARAAASAPPSRLNERARAALADTQATIAALDLQAGKPVQAETRLREQITALETVVKQIDPEDKRALSLTYFSLGTSYYYLANARAMQGQMQDVKPNLERARDALNACIQTIGDARFQSDRFRKINVQPNCFCARADVQKSLEQLR